MREEGNVLRLNSAISGTPVCRCLVGLKNLSLIKSIKRKAALKRYSPCRPWAVVSSLPSLVDGLGHALS